MATKIFLNNDWQDYDYDTLYSTLGYTKIKCEVYAKEGDYVWSWYNPVMREYWDDREWKKLWTPIPPKPLDEIPFLVFDNGLGRIVHTTEEDILSYSDIPPHVISDSLMSYSDISVTTISDTTMITTLELGVAVQSFFFTNKGNKETENSERRGSVNDFIYDETGHLIVGEDIDAGYDNAPVLSLTQVDGNMLSPINGDYIYMSSTRRNWYFHPERGTRFVWSLQVKRLNPEIKTAYFNDEGASETGDVAVGRNTNYSLYDEFGVKILYSDTTHYEIVGVYKFDGTRLDTSSGDYIRANTSTPLSLLWMSNVLPETGRYYYAFKLMYREYPVSLAYAQNKASVTVNQGSSITLYSDDGQTPITYDPNKQYILCMVTGGIPYNLHPVTAELYGDSNNHLACKNTSSSTLSFKYLTYRIVNRR